MARISGVPRKMSRRYKRASETFNERLQKHKYEYLQETGKVLVTTRELAVWAISTERWEPPPDLALRKCREDYSRALHEEYIKDADGQPVHVNQAARQRIVDGQMTLWGDIRKIPRSHMETSSTQRREQIVALAFPPLRPPSRPRATAAGFFSFSALGGSASGTTVSRTCRAISDGSFGLLERLGISEVYPVVL